MTHLLLQTKFAQTDEGLVVDLAGVQRYLAFDIKFPRPRDGWSLEDMIFHAGYYFVRLYNGPNAAYWVFSQDFDMIAAAMDQFIAHLTDAQLWAVLSTPIDSFASDVDDDVSIQRIHDLMSALAAKMVATGRLKPDFRTVGSNSEDAAVQDVLGQLNTPSRAPGGIFQSVILQERLVDGAISASNSAFGDLVFDRFLPLDNFWYIGFSSNRSHSCVAFITSHNKHVTCLYDTDRQMFWTNINLSSCGFNDVHVYRAVLMAFWFYPLLSQGKTPEFRKVGVVFRENHVGHYVWNELGLLQALRELHREAYVFLYPSCNEPVFKIESLFPETTGRVFRNASAAQHLVASIVDGVEFFPFMVYHISQAYADLFTARAKEMEAGFYADLMQRKSERLLLLIGLRVENRTWLRQKEGYIELVSELAKLGRPVTIMFDGHNYLDAEAGTFVTSHNELAASSADFPPIVQLERDIVDHVEQYRHDNGLDSIEIVNLIPCSISRSILAALCCDYMVTHWGAGLAKYTWLGGADGCIISCRDVLSTKHDLLIYDSPEFKQNARPFFYYPYERITDTGTQTHAIRIGAPDRNDFDMDPAEFAQTVRELVRQRLRVKVGY